MNTHKFLLPALLLFSSFLTSCSKEGNTSPEKLSMNKSAAAVNGEIGILAADTSTVKQNLAAAPWLYYEVFGAYYTTGSKLLYKHERAVELNTLNLRGNTITFNSSNNTFVETSSSQTLQGYYYFDINWATDDIILNTVVTYPQLLAKVSVTLQRIPDGINGPSYVWYNKDLDRFGIMYHPNTVPVSGTGSVASRLTGKQWIYENYFSDYTVTNCSLVYRRNRGNGVRSVVDMSTLVYVFTSDGRYTVTKIDPQGNSIVSPGIWWLTDNDTKLHLQDDKFGLEEVYEISMLNNERFQWLWMSGSRGFHADMVVWGTTFPKTKP